MKFFSVVFPGRIGVPLIRCRNLRRRELKFDAFGGVRPQSKDGVEHASSASLRALRRRSG